FTAEPARKQLRRLSESPSALQQVVKVRRRTEAGDAPGWQGATTENRGPRRARVRGGVAISGIFEGGAKQPDPGSNAAVALGWRRDAAPAERGPQRGCRAGGPECSRT